MSDPNDVWQDSAPAGDRDRSPRRERERSRSPAPRNGGDRGDREDRGDRGDRGRMDRGDAPQNQGNNLHVSGLAKSVDIPMLEDVFGKIGKIYKAEIMFDPHTQESRGFGFVKMDLAEDAAACIDQLNGTTLEGKVLTVAIAKRGRARTPTPGQYHGFKLEDRGGPGGYGGGGYGGRGGGYGDRPYQPRQYDSRYDRGPPRYDDRRYDDRRFDDRRYDDRRDDRPRYDDRRDDRPRYDDRRGGGGYDDRREPRRDDRSRYDERPSTGGV